MPTHDIIDNRNGKLVDYINRILTSTERAKFAVGYFFLPGFELIQNNLQRVTELKLLIGNTTDRQPLPSCPNTVRWRNTAQWSRNSLVQEGLMKADSSWGIWKISDRGGEALKRGEV